MSYLFLSILVIQVSLIFSTCKLRHTAKGVPGYVCNSISDLTQNAIVTDIIDLSIQVSNLGTVIDSSYFYKLPNLHTLEFRSSIGVIKPRTFDSLPALSKLVLHYNHLPRIRRDTFENLPISYLSLDSNDIAIIEENAFNNMTNLDTLRISNNTLRTVEYGIFNGLSVELLALSNNNIQHIVEQAFYNMTRLKRLHLDGNMLRQFQPKLLMNYGSKLEILWLHKNLLREIDRNLVNGLYNLRLLNLDANEITKIFIYAFENLQYLQSLILSGNNLEELDADIFPLNGMPNMKLLYLHNNRFTYLTTNLMLRLNGLTNIRIFGNPWQCACLDLIVRWLHDLKITAQCSGDYLNGTKPICVVGDLNPTVCRYVHDQFYYNKFKEFHTEFPKEPACVL